MRKSLPLVYMLLCVFLCLTWDCPSIVFSDLPQIQSGDSVSCILALLWFTLLLHFLVPVASILSIFEGGCGVAESGRSRLIWLARMLGYFFGGVRIVTLPLNLRVLLPSIFASLLCIYGGSSTLPLVESFRSRSFRQKPTFMCPLLLTSNDPSSYLSLAPKTEKSV